MKSKRDQLREKAELSFEFFIRLVDPKRMLGGIHLEWISWLTRMDRKSHQLTLLPRGHQKSAILGFYAVWRLTKNPAITILYISSTSNLAVKQLKFMKDILTSDIYRLYWPEMVTVEESKREKWTETEISVDHPLRKERRIREPSIFTAGLTTSITGLHCDLTIPDDLVVMENAYTDEGRSKVRAQYSLLTSIENPEAEQVAAGTRYHPNDLYNDMKEMSVSQYADDGSELDGEPLFEVFERQVESQGDGYGEFLWPRQKSPDGRWFGFDAKILARKKASYLDRIQFKAQYYNDPNDYENAGITRDQFQYYDKKYLTCDNGKWYYKLQKLNVFAGIDFAYSLAKRADYTAITVVGVSADSQYYILDIDRFKTSDISEYFSHILALHQKWDVRVLIAECTAAQQMLVNDLKTNYIQKQGLALSIKEQKPTRHDGTKEERIELTLQPRYANNQIWHYQSGNCQTLEDELVLSRPPHDDVKDCLAMVIAGCQAPTMSRTGRSKMDWKQNTHSRFGGVI